MDEKVIDIRVVGKEKGFDKIKRKAKEYYTKTKDWCIDHQEELLVYVPLALAAITSVCKTANKAIDANREKKLKDMYIYDRSLGRYIELKRPLNQRDLTNITSRRQNNERLTDILLDMNLVR